ncbi:hypothetical protein BW730_09340 [Tessaracoccus aquimaris]|uniref:Major facilitator superfamily (MFS) profile domain-containing protein n=1 Tax=Tessaracoccus aquimaris TaxID=1332264 RepID=A0A1Q2CNL0_9ACTN|nr:MFS transporter [Tessaracoccus aquimaris]AQP47665.1 hypothetical protein BW730_09340 [Tessaracoccus aquimaris]
MQTTGSRVVLIVGIMLSVFTVAFQSIGLATALPTLMSYFDAGHLYPWAFTTMISGMLLATIFAGRLADKRGPALPMYLGFALFGIGLVLGWLAPTVWVVLLARLVQGLGAGALNLTLSVVVAHGFPPKERPRAMALVSFCWLLPAFIGPPFAAWLTQYSWRLVFAAMIPLVAVAFLITLRGLRQVQEGFTPGEDEVGPVAVLPTAAVTVAPSLILLAGQGLGVWSVFSAIVGVGAMVWGLPKILAPAARGFRPGVPSVVLTRAIQAGSFFAAETILLVTLQDLRGYSPFQVGWALTVGSLGWTLGSWVQAQAWVRLDRDTFITRRGALQPRHRGPDGVRVPPLPADLRRPRGLDRGGRRHGADDALVRRRGDEPLIALRAGPQPVVDAGGRVRRQLGRDGGRGRHLHRAARRSAAEVELRGRAGSDAAGVRLRHRRQQADRTDPQRPQFVRT